MTADEITYRMAWLRQQADDGGRTAIGDDTRAEIDEIERLALSAIEAKRLAALERTAKP